MNCKDFSNLLDAYVDGSLSQAEANQMRDHAAACPDCAAMLTLLQDARRMDEEIEVPEAFSSSWRQRIREEEKMEEKRIKNVPWKTWLAAAAVLVFVLGGTALTRGDMPSRTQLTGAASNSAQAKTTGSSVARRNADNGNVLFEDMAAPMMMAAYEDYNAAEKEEAAAEVPAAGEARRA